MRSLIFACLFLLPLTAAAQFWCWEADVLEVELIGADLEIRHEADLINCCPEPISYDVEVGDATIFVQENWESVCDCDCCYDLKVKLTDVPPGPWVLRYRWFEIEEGDWVEAEFNIEVPDLGQGYEPAVSEILDSGCLMATSVPTLPDPPSSWTAVKALYR